MTWCAIYTKPRWEKKVLGLLLKNNITAYCPIVKEQRIWSDRKKIVEKVLISSYVFVKITEAEKTKVRMIEGVVNFVYEAGKIAIIKEIEIKTLEKFIQQYYNYEISASSLKIGSVIEINNKLIGNEKATIIKLKNKNVELYLNNLNIIITAKYKNE